MDPEFTVLQRLVMKKIRTALISVFHKKGLEKIIALLHEHGVVIYSTGGTYDFIRSMEVDCIPVETLTGYPSILGGRVKTLHPLVFGGILGRRNNEQDLSEMKEHGIPDIDLVIVDLYPFQDTVREEKERSLSSGVDINEQAIIEKIDIGGPSMIRAAAKNHHDVAVLASPSDYPLLEHLLEGQGCSLDLAQRRVLASRAFDVCTEYDNAISNYFNNSSFETPFRKEKLHLRYGENPHQPAAFYGDLTALFTQLHGKELSYNNLVDIDAAIQLIRECDPCTFAIIKHTNVCGIAGAGSLEEAWNRALQGDPESAFGGVLICNEKMDVNTAKAINELFFEVLAAPGFDEQALKILQSKKNRILLSLKDTPLSGHSFRSLLNGIITQQTDAVNHAVWNETGGRTSTERERTDMIFANIICKHLKSNAIALVKEGRLIGKGCGQTSRVDALRQAIEKSRQFGFDLSGAVMASDAFFPFDDCVKLGHAAGITAFIQPGGSIRDSDSVNYCRHHGLVMVLTGSRHFKH